MAEDGAQPAQSSSSPVVLSASTAAPEPMAPTPTASIGQGAAAAPSLSPADVPMTAPLANPAASPSSAPPTLAQPQASQTPQPQSGLSPAGLAMDRQDLLTKARTFLSSPQAQYQDTATKAKFLMEKGLHTEEINRIVRELPVQRPVVPPRTYPQLPPSNLPRLLLGMFRVFSWLLGGSLALIVVYYKFLLPRIVLTMAARRSINAHQKFLLDKLTSSIQDLKKSQGELYDVLPRPEYFKESDEYVGFNSVAAILKHVEEKEIDVGKVPGLSLLRCALEDLKEAKEGEEKTEEEKMATTPDLFRYLEEKIPWLETDEGLAYEHTLWQTLNTTPSFTHIEVTITPPDSPTEPIQTQRWSYTAPASPPPTALIQSLTKLQKALPRAPSPHTAPAHERERGLQRTLQTLSDFTGWLSTQIYLPYRPPGGAMGMGMGMGYGTSPVPGSEAQQASPEEEMKKEIRALKGLVLNRRSFMPTPTPTPAPTPNGAGVSVGAAAAGVAAGVSRGISKFLGSGARANPPTPVQSPLGVNGAGVNGASINGSGVNGAGVNGSGVGHGIGITGVGSPNGVGLGLTPPLFPSTPLGYQPVVPMDTVGAAASVTTPAEPVFPPLPSSILASGLPAVNTPIVAAPVPIPAVSVTPAVIAAPAPAPENATTTISMTDAAPPDETPDAVLTSTPAPIVTTENGETGAGTSESSSLVGVAGPSA